MTISSITDIRTWVSERVANATEQEIDSIVSAIQRDRNSPAYGRDWSEYFAALPENLADLI